MINVPIDVSLGIAILGSILAVLAWVDSRRKAAVSEGKHVQTVDQLKEDLNRCHEKLRNLGDRLNTSDVNVGEIKADIRHILDAITRVEGKLDGHISKEVAE